MTTTRKTAYTISALAVACFFLLPEPRAAVVIALMLQTIAFIIVAGSSLADGLLLCAISLLLFALLPADHPMVAGSVHYATIRGPLILSAAGLGAIAVASMIYSARRPK